MDKTTSDKEQISGEFSNRPKVKIRKPSKVVVENLVEEPVEEVKEELTPSCVEVEPADNSGTLYQAILEQAKDDNRKYLIIIFVLLFIIALLGFAFCYEHSCRVHEQQGTDVRIDAKYEDLQKLVSKYVSGMKDPNKRELANKLSDVYVEAATAKGDINDIEKTIKTKSRDILGFNEPGYSSKTDYEYEWQGLFDATGVINTWLMDSDILITKDNQKDVFMVIAKGLK